MADVSHQVVEGTFRLLYRQQMYARTGNGCYAAEAWIIARRMGVPMPEWVLSAVDLAAETGRFYSKTAVGSGKKSDVRRKDTDTTEILNQIMAAYELFDKNPTWSQEKIALELGLDRGRFSLILKKHKLPDETYPWRAVDRKGRS